MVSFLERVHCVQVQINCKLFPKQTLKIALEIMKQNNINHQGLSVLHSKYLASSLFFTFRSLFGVLKIERNFPKQSATTTFQSHNWYNLNSNFILAFSSVVKTPLCNRPSGIFIFARFSGKKGTGLDNSPMGRLIFD